MHAIPLELGQSVRRRGDPRDGDVVGRLVGVVLSPAFVALVRWDIKNSTFESFDNLVHSAQRPQ